MSNQPIPLSDLAPAYYDEQIHRAEHPEDYIGYRTGFEYMDKLFGGWGRNWDVIIRSKTGKGKTTFLATVAFHFALQGISWCWFGLEENEMEIVERQFAVVSQIPRATFRDIQVSELQWPVLAKARDIIKDWRAWISYGAYEIDDVEKFTKEVNPQVVMVDYIQLMNATKMRYNNRVLEISNISSRLVNIAKKDNRLLMVAAQESDSGDVLWSKDVSRVAGVVIGIEDVLDNTQKPLPDRRGINIAKSKYSSPGSFEATMNGELGIFCDLNQKIVNPDNIAQEWLNAPDPRFRNPV